MKAGIESRDKAVKEAALRLRDLRAEVDSILNQNAPETEGAPS